MWTNVQKGRQFKRCHFMLWFFCCLCWKNSIKRCRWNVTLINTFSLVSILGASLFFTLSLKLRNMHWTFLLYLRIKPKYFILGFLFSKLFEPCSRNHICMKTYFICALANLECLVYKISNSLGPLVKLIVLRIYYLQNAFIFRRKYIYVTKDLLHYYMNMN